MKLNVKLWKVWTQESFKSRLSLIVRVNVVLNRTVVADSDWRFDNLCGSHLQSQSELYHVSWWYVDGITPADKMLRLPGFLHWGNRQKPKHATDRTQTSDEEWWRQQSHCWAPFKDETSNWLGLCDMYNVFYRLLSTSYLRKLVY